MNFYRIRPLTRAMKELEEQRIYFAPFDELNDPMEGLKDLFWQGDAIAWKNLFRHYVSCYVLARFHALVSGDEEPLKLNLLPFHDPGHEGIPAGVKDTISGVLDDFLALPGMEKFFDDLAARTAPVRREELALYLQGLHPWVESSSNQVFTKLGLQPRAPEPHRQPPMRPEEALAHLLGMPAIQDSLGSGALDALDAVNDAASQLRRQMDLINSLHYHQHQQKWHFLHIFFPSEYLNQLDSLVHRRWHCACFSEDVIDSSMWGTYGESHTGVALQFKASEVSGRWALPLVRPGGSYLTSKPVTSSIPFEKIQYGEKPLPIDFFSSLGTLTMSELKKWHYDAKGNLSSTSRSMRDEESWRAQYWKALKSIATFKHTDWRHEREHRLIVTPMVSEMPTVEDRLFEFKFDNLNGVVFGIKTPLDIKVKIVQLVRDKCAATSRRDFNFYQAYYDRQSGGIRCYPMTLLKFDV